MSRYDNCRYSHKPYPCYCMCPSGRNGKSAYEIALDNGFVGTEIEWLESLKGEPGEPTPFLSSYIEALGDTQDVAFDENFVFNTDLDIIDIVGSDITIDDTGTIFTITRAGLYHVEWSMNLISENEPALVGLMEADEGASVLSNKNVAGNYSSGALINVMEGDLPYTISLHNFGAPVSVENPLVAVNTAVSLRILRFADGVNV